MDETIVIDVPNRSDNNSDTNINNQTLIISDTLSVSFTDHNLRGIIDNFCKQAEEATGFPSNHEGTDQPILIVDLLKNYAEDNGHNDLPLNRIPKSGFMMEIFHDHIYLTGDNREGVKLGLSRLLDLLNEAEYTEAGIEIKGRALIEGPIH